MPSRSEGRESSSRRSRSRRSRNRHRSHHRHHRTRSRTRIKSSDKNFPAAICNMLAIVLLSTSLAEPKWISLTGGSCTIQSKGGNTKALHYLGAYQFFYPGKFLAQERELDNSVKHVTYQFGPNDYDQMDNCVTYKAALLMKTVIAFCFLAILSSLSGFLLDLFVPKQKASRMLQRNAVPSIITVILSVVINLFCYWFSMECERLQIATKQLPGSKVVVDFDISFYLVTAAGGISVIATAFNCLKRHNPLYDDTTQGEPLLDDYDGMSEPFLPPPGPDMSQMLNLPSPQPPPAYTP